MRRASDMLKCLGEVFRGGGGRNSSGCEWGGSFYSSTDKQAGRQAYMRGSLKNTEPRGLTDSHNCHKVSFKATVMYFNMGGYVEDLPGLENVI